MMDPVSSLLVSPHRIAAARTDVPARDTAPKRGGPSAPRFGVRYFPCFGALPVVVALLLAAPAAMWVREESRFPSWVSCTGPSRPAPAAASDGNPVWQTRATCAARDARVVRNSAELPCNALLAALDSFVGPSTLLRRSLLHGIDNRPPTGAGVGYSSPAQSSRLDPASARALLAQCIESSPSVGTPRTVEVMVTDCDYLPSVFVACAVLALVVVAGLRRRVVVHVDLACGALVVVERGFLRERRTLLIDTDRVEDVVVAAGPTAFLSGRRVELVCSDGDRVPLTHDFVALTYGVHHRVARRLLAYVDGARRMRRIAEA